MVILVKPAAILQGELQAAAERLVMDLQTIRVKHHKLIASQIMEAQTLAFHALSAVPAVLQDSVAYTINCPTNFFFQ